MVLRGKVGKRGEVVKPYFQYPPEFGGEAVCSHSTSCGSFGKQGEKAEALGMKALATFLGLGKCHQLSFLPSPDPVLYPGLCFSRLFPWQTFSAAFSSANSCVLKLGPYFHLGLFQHLAHLPCTKGAALRLCFKHATAKCSSPMVSQCSCHSGLHFCHHLTSPLPSTVLLFGQCSLIPSQFLQLAKVELGCDMSLFPTFAPLSLTFR